jgi:hypothetical protein
VVITGTPANIRRFIAEATKPYPEGDETPAEHPERIIDFDLIIPMPPGLRDTVSPHEVVATQEEADQKNAEYNAQPFSKMFRDDDAAPQVKYMTMTEVLRRMGEYGATNWYDWSVTNWGTKWGAYSHSHYRLSWAKKYGEDDVIYGRVDLRFETAWSQPTPIFQTIEERWDVEVRAITQDEGGYPDVPYGTDPFDVLNREVTFTFENWDTEIEEPALNPDSVGAGHPEEQVNE